jgi:hypothetical protein
MYTIAHSPEIVAKETLATMKFAAEDVLPLPAQKQWRRQEAERATTLGNGYRGKVDIYFQTAEGETKRVYTTVWANDAEHISLKAGTAIPLRSVIGFDFY